MARGMDVTFKDVTLRFKNFSGRETDYNAAGQRNFRVDLTDEMAEYLNNVELTTKSGMLVKGANVKTYVPKDEGADPRYSIAVKFGDFEPEEMWYVTSKGKIRLDMDNVGILDRMFIERAKVQVRLSAWEQRGRSGITAYLKKLIVWVKEDDFDKDEDFANLPEVGVGPVSGPDSEDEDLPF